MQMRLVLIYHVNSRLSPAKFDQGSFGAGDKSKVDEAGFPLVSICEAANKVMYMKAMLNHTNVQREMIREQKEKLMQQERELKAMEEMHLQLMTGRAITNVVCQLTTLPFPVTCFAMMPKYTYPCFFVLHVWPL